MQQVPGTQQRLRTATPVDTILDGQVRIADRLHQLVADDGERVYGTRGAVLPERFSYTGIARHRLLAISPYPSSVPAVHASLEEDWS